MTSTVKPKKKPMIPPRSAKTENRRALLKPNIMQMEPNRPPSASLSVYSDSSSTLENGDSQPQSPFSRPQSPFVCSISPGTMQSMELAFSFNDEDIVDKLSGSWPVKCTYVVKELIDTERVYVQSLVDVIKGYLTPLYGYVLDTGESPNFIKTVFGNIVKIHQVNTRLLDSMQSSSTAPQDFARAFLDCDFLTQYTPYCTNYSKGSMRLEHTLAGKSDIKNLILECQTNLCHSLPLHSELIKPVQRILKYPLLLEELSKNFTWTDHPGYRLLREAVDKMSSVAVQINTAFNDPGKPSTTKTPKDIAQKRSHQLTELQKGRSAEDSRDGPNHSALKQTNSLPYSYRAALFPTPISPNHTLPYSYRTAAAPTPNYSSRPDRFAHLREKSSASLHRTESFYESRKSTSESDEKPLVKDLKGYFEKLTEKTEGEMMMMSAERRGTGSIRSRPRASSLEDSFVNIPQAAVTRTPSLGNLHSVQRQSIGASGSSGDSGKEQSIKIGSFRRRFGFSKKLNSLK